MDNYELKINGKFAAVGKDFGIRLNRQILNPSELNTKDAQYSFSISLPPVAVNHEIFNYSNIEETRDKFNREYTAELNVNGVRVFPPADSSGFFKMGEISARGYKGNLYVPVPKSAKDIFGETKLNQNPEYRIDFEDFAASVNGYNEAAATVPQAAIFPLTLYGVLPKGPLNKNGNTYSARELWDDTVQMTIQNLPPSLNVLILLKHIFNARGYSLTGSAFDDVKLTRLYLSYKNAEEYVQPWNYGQHAKIHVRGNWSSTQNRRTSANELERGVTQGSDVSGPLYGCDLLDATNTQLAILEDSGGNVLYNEVNDASGRTFVRAQIRIPISGFYKVEFNASLKINDVENWRTTDAATGVQHVGGRSDHQNNALNDSMYEIRLCRDKGAREFGILDPALNGLFYYNNLPQNTTFDSANIPKYFPQSGANGQLNFIDQAQDPAHLMGFNFGWQGSTLAVINGQLVVVAKQKEFNNPKAGVAPNAQVLVSKPALSWDASQDSDKVTRLAVDADGYWKYGRIGDFDNEGDNPNTNLDYSAGPFVTGKTLDANGNPITPANELTARTTGYQLNKSSGLPVIAAGWEVSGYIDLASYTPPTFSGVTSNASNTAITAFYDANKQFIGAGLLAPDPVRYLYGGLTWTQGQFWNTAGAAVASANMATTSNIPLNGLNNTTVLCAGTPAAGIRHIFLDAGGAFISSFGDDSTTGSWDVADVKAYAVPSNARFVSFSWTSLAFGHNGGFEATLPTYTTHTNRALSAPAGARYFRIGANVSPTFTIAATSLYNNNKILNRFALARYYTYVITAPAGSNYEGYAYVHDGATNTLPVIKVPFVGGVATFDTSFDPILTIDARLTIYLKTPNFDVSTTLTISRRIEGDSVEVIDWELTDKFKIDLINAPTTYAKIGQYMGTPADANWNAQGSSNGVVWLEAGELLTIASVSGEGAYRRDGMHSTYGWTSHEVVFDLSVQPFRTDKDWLKVDLNGHGTAVMDWNDASNFDTDSINLVGFLSADIKTDDFIDNFCKAFNLRLSQVAADAFTLSIKQSRASVSNLFIDLDNVTSVDDRGNTPLGLPAAYNIGFTVDPDEEGFVESGDDGGGTFVTGALEGSIVEQKSTFSYNWFKQITKVETGGNVFLDLAIISKKDVWNPALPYPDAMAKSYTDLAYRFWYYDGLLNASGATFIFNGADLKIAKVSNEIAGLSVLSYKNQKYTILDNYFTVLINGSSHYTEVEGYITPTQYQSLDGAIYAMFNRDLYFIAEITGYDPTARNKTKLKLIRKI